MPLTWIRDKAGPSILPWIIWYACGVVDRRHVTSIFELALNKLWQWKWPPLLSSGQSFRLQIQWSGFDSLRDRNFWEVVGLERGPLSLVSTTEELLERKGSCSGLESREYGHRDQSHWPRFTLYLQKLALTSPTSGGRSVGIVCSRIQATEFVFVCLTAKVRYVS
jgi:hypothetical protein